MEKMTAKKPLTLHPNGSRPVKVGDCVVGYVTGKARNPRTWALAGQRLSEIEEVIRSRHGAFVGGDDACSYIEPLAAAVANARRATIRKEGREASNSELVAAVIAACRRWLPKLPADEIEEAAHDAVDQPRFESADALGKLLGISFVERQALGLKTIGCRDLNKRQRAAAIKKGKLDRRKAKKRAEGVKPREEYEGNSVRAIAVSWGVSRQTVYDWRKHGDPRGLYKCVPNITPPICGTHMSSGPAKAKRPQGASRPKAAGSEADALSGSKPVAPRTNTATVEIAAGNATIVASLRYAAVRLRVAA